MAAYGPVTNKKRVCNKNIVYNGIKGGRRGEDAWEGRRRMGEEGAETTFLNCPKAALEITPRPRFDRLVLAREDRTAFCCSLCAQVHVTGSISRGSSHQRFARWGVLKARRHAHLPKLATCWVKACNESLNENLFRKSLFQPRESSKKADRLGRCCGLPAVAELWLRLGSGELESESCLQTTVERVIQSGVHH